MFPAVGKSFSASCTIVTSDQIPPDLSPKGRWKHSMISTEKGILPGSDYYVYTPSAQAQSLFFYPLIIGNFSYSDDYSLRRTAFDNFLLMYIKRGECIIELNDQVFRALPGQIVFLDCYHPHTYKSTVPWECEWLHFDGRSARDFYQAITNGTSPVISLKDTYRFERYLHKIYLHFREHLPLKEALLNNYIVNMLTELFVSRDRESPEAISGGIIEDTIAYINNHLTEILSLNDLASQASLSPFYFSRLFKKETGFSPHEYVILSRINNAKYLLNFPELSIKDVCFKTGFSSESSFCTTFKKSVGMTPSEYRLTCIQNHN